MWIFYSVITALLESAKDIQSKYATTDLDENTTALHYQLFSLVILIPAAIVSGIPTIQPLFYPAVVIGSILASIWTVWYMRALKGADVSEVVPLLAFNPVFTALLSPVFRDSLPDIRGWVGIGLVSAGLYIQKLNRYSLTHQPWAPIISTFSNPASRAMLGVALIWSLGAHITKLTSTTSSPYFSSLVSTILSCLIIWFSLPQTKKIGAFTPKLNFKQLGFLGLSNGLSKITLRLALESGITAYVMPIKRTNIILSSLYGKYFLKENFSKPKTIGLILMFLGVVLIIL